MEGELLTMTALTSYQSLLLDFTPRPIHTQREYNRALKYLEQQMEPRPDKAKGQMLELLSTLIAQYETSRYPAADVAPGEMVAHYMEAQGLTKAEIARGTGLSRQTITNIVNGRRGITPANIQKLAAFFHVPPSVFLPEA